MSQNRTHTADVKIYNFWVASGPFFDSTIFLTPPDYLSVIENKSDISKFSELPETYTSLIKFYDPDGSLVNEVECNFPSSQVGILELGPLMESCKYEAGIKHAQISVYSVNAIKAICRIFARQSATFMGELRAIDTMNRAFFPIAIGEGRTSLVAICNFSKESNAVRLKLFVGKRSPEILVQVPAGGTRLVSLEAEFGEYIDRSPALQRGYIRASAKNDLPGGIQLLERIETSQEDSIYSSLT